MQRKVELNEATVVGDEIVITRTVSIDPTVCAHFILTPVHYRDDGTCKCNDAEHRAMMIREWEYTEADFADPTN